MAEQVAALLTQGLDRFSARDHAGASACWLEALSLDPGCVRAREFLTYLARTPAEPPLALRLDDALAPLPPPAELSATAELPELPPAPPLPVPPLLVAPLGAPPPVSEVVAPSPRAALPAIPVESTPAFGSPLPPPRAAQVADRLDENTPRPSDWFASNSGVVEAAAAPVSLDSGARASGADLAEGLPELDDVDLQASVPAGKPVAGPMLDGLDDLDVDVDDLLPPPSELTPGRAVSEATPGGQGRSATSFGDLRTPVGAVPGAPGAPSEAVSPQVAELLAEVRAKETAGDLTGALDAVDKVLELDPNQGDALSFMARNEETLVALYAAMLGPMERVPHVLVQPDDVTWLSLHHKAGFVLSHVDGGSSFEDIVALCGMSPLEASRILAQLLLNGVIAT